MLTRVGQLDEAIAVTSDVVHRMDAVRRAVTQVHRTIDLFGRQNCRRRCLSPSQPASSARRGMTTETQPGPDQYTLTRHGADTAVARLGTIGELYAEIYAEPPYRGGPADVADFAASWPRRVAQPNFRLILAQHGDQQIGFSFGFQLTVESDWWDGALSPLPADLITERPARTFAFIEIAVRSSYRRRGVARRMHAVLTAGQFPAHP